MSGIYIHIPFCRKKCHYCNFVSVASLKWQPDYIQAILKEIELQKSFYFPETPVETVYFGGGTPSVLSVSQVSEILDKLNSVFFLHNNSEITFEVNPDDATPEYLRSLKQAGINRLSIGTQSFHNSELEYLGRTHSAETSIKSVFAAKDAGFDNVSIDIIYGLPESVSGDPNYNIEQALIADVQHISAYSLTMEPGTILANLAEKNKMLPPDEELSVTHFRLYMKLLVEAGYEHYEISNFAKQGYRSKHNSAYWQNKAYLGLGAGAHSFDQDRRFINTGIITEYIRGILNDTPSRETEVLSINDRYNDYIITTIRTSDGCNLKDIYNQFGEEFGSYFLKNIQPLIEKQLIISEDSHYFLTENGKLWTDSVSEKLIIDADHML